MVPKAGGNASDIVRQCLAVSSAPIEPFRQARSEVDSASVAYSTSTVASYECFDYTGTSREARGSAHPPRDQGW